MCSDACVIFQNQFPPELSYLNEMFTFEIQSYSLCKHADLLCFPRHDKFPFGGRSVSEKTMGHIEDFERTVGSSLHREEWLRHKGLESIHPSPSSRSQTQNEFPNMGLSPCDNMWHCEKVKPLSLPAKGLFDVVFMKWSPLVHGMA